MEATVSRSVAEPAALHASRGFRSTDNTSINLFITTPDGAVLAEFPSALSRSQAAFSRDGSSIVYYQQDGDVGTCVMNTDDSDARRILGFEERHSLFVTPRWRP
jgi:hypothetical protein